MAVATGRPFLGRFPVPQARPVIYVGLEGAKASISVRLQAIARGIGEDPDAGIPNLRVS